MDALPQAGASLALQTVLGQPDLPAKLLHRGFRPLFANPAAADLFGFDSAAELMAQPSLAPLFGVEADLADAWARATAFEGPYFSRRTLRRRDGAPLRVETLARAVTLPHGPVVALAFRDIAAAEAASRGLRRVHMGVNARALRSRLSGRRLLVIDDHAAARRLVCAMARALGHSALAAGSGPEGLSALRVQRFDLALIDIQMPGMDGFETARRIRALSGPGADVPIAAVTAGATADIRDAAAEAGMDGFIAKPISLAGLASQILLLTSPRLVEAAELEQIHDENQHDEAENDARRSPAAHCRPPN